MLTDDSFKLSLDFNHTHYDGLVTPSEEKSANGKPVYFRVTIDGKMYAYICCGDNGWRERDGQDRPPELIDAIGTYIQEYYD